MKPNLHAQTKKLGTAPIGTLLLQLGFPGMLSMFIMALYNLADTFWVAKLGAHALAALTIVFPYQMLVVALGAGSGAGFSSLLSRHFGAGKTNETNKITGQVFPLVLIFGTLFFLITQYYADPVLRFFGSTPDIHGLSRDYLTVVGLGAYFIFFSMISHNTFRGAGNTVLPMIFMAVAAILNIILDPLFIFGFGFIPAMGVQGAAIATVISQGLGAFIACIFLFSRHSVYKLNWTHMIPDFQLLKKIFAVGLPTFFMQVLASFVVMLTNKILATYGSSAIAANGLIFRILMVIVMPIAGLAHGLLPIIGFNYGAKYIKRLWHAVSLASLISAAFIGVGFIFLELFPDFWIKLFLQNNDFLPLAKRALRIVMLTITLLGPFFMWVTTFQALGKGLTALCLSSVRHLILILLLLFLLPKLLGTDGVWMAFPIADTLAFILATYMIRKEYILQHRNYVCEKLETTSAFEQSPLG